MKVAFVVTRSDAVGGAQVHVRDLAAALRAGDHAPVVLVGGDGPWLEQLRDRGIDVIVLKRLARSISPVRDIRALFELWSVLRRVRPDLVSTHTAKAGVLGRIAAFALRIPVIFTAHGWTFTEGISRGQAFVWRMAERMVGPLADRIVTVSEFDRRLGVRAHIAGPDRIVTILNGMPDVSVDLFADASRQPPELVMVARFEDQKDHRTLLQALGTLRDLEWRMTFVGGGPLEAEMKALCMALGISERVHFLGARADVAQILSRAQVFVLCTCWEGLPRSIIEAMRQALPVVATDVAGIPEEVDDGVTGLLCRVRDPKDVAAKLRAVIESPALRAQMGKRGRERYEALFRFSRMYDEVIRVYEAVT